jgi:YHS domain-containing protein
MLKYKIRPSGSEGRGGRAETAALTIASYDWWLDNARRRQAMEKDVVCGMQVDPAKAAATSEYNGKTYYFCAKSCKTKFDANPAQYVK